MRLLHFEQRHSFHSDIGKSDFVDFGHADSRAHSSGKHIAAKNLQNCQLPLATQLHEAAYQPSSDAERTILWIDGNGASVNIPLNIWKTTQYIGSSLHEVAYGVHHPNVALTWISRHVALLLQKQKRLYFQFESYVLVASRGLTHRVSFHDIRQNNAHNLPIAVHRFE